MKFAVMKFALGESSLYRVFVSISGNSAPKLIGSFKERIFQDRNGILHGELGEDIQLNCKFSGCPRPTVAWLLDGFPISHNNQE